MVISGMVAEENLLYTDVSRANTSDSLNRIINVPMKTYKFKYDSIADRKHLGILGADAQQWFPDSVDVVASHTIPHQNKSEPLTVLKNFPIVNKQVLYMHGIAALQELAKQILDMQKDIAEISSNSQVYELTFTEIEKQLFKEMDAKLLERKRISIAEAELAQKERLLEKVREEEDKKSILLELEQEKALLVYEEDLTRQRISHSLELSKANVDRSIALEKELAMRREELRKEMMSALQDKRLQLEKELERQKLLNDREKIITEVRAKAEQERANEDVTIRQLQAKSKLDTERMVQGIKLISQHVTIIVTDLVSKPQQLAMVMGVLLLALAVYYAIREFTVLLRQFVQSKLGKPALIRETSRYSAWVPSFLQRKASSITSDMEALKDHFKDVILSDDDKDRVLQLALTTRNTKRTGAPYRHVLLYGPPGTGKTMIARKLAYCSGMDYAIMSGGDVGPLGEDAVNQLHALFRWAGTSSKGLLLFIDEAEAFLSSRNNTGDSGEAGSESTEGSSGAMHIRHALNALLYQTGVQSTTFMMVLATNRPEDLDSAVLDRIDVSHLIGLPALPQRKQLVSQYYDVHILGSSDEVKTWYSALLSGKKTDKLGLIPLELLQRLLTMKIEDKQEGSKVESEKVRGKAKTQAVSTKITSDSTLLSDIAEEINGFSGREISKMCIALRYAISLCQPSDMTTEDVVIAEVSMLIRKVVTQKIKEHEQKTKGFKG